MCERMWSLSEQSHTLSWWQQGDKKSCSASCASPSFRWLPSSSSLRKSGPSPIFSPPRTTPPPTAIHPPVPGSCGPSCWSRETELPVPTAACLCHGFLLRGTSSHGGGHQATSASPWDNTHPGSFKACPQTLLQLTGVISHPPAPRRIGGPSQEGKVTHLKEEEKLLNVTQGPEFKHSLVLLWELWRHYDKRIEVQGNKPKCL